MGEGKGREGKGRTGQEGLGFRVYCTFPAPGCGDVGSCEITIFAWWSL
jgi:hypothetical protein